MLIKKELLIILFFLSSALFAGTGESIYDARSAGMGSSGLSLQGPFSVFNNVAGLGNSHQWSFGATAISRYAFGDLKEFSVGGVIPTRSGSFGLGVHREGIDALSENRVTLGYGRVVSESLVVGLGFDYLGLSIQDHGSSGVFTANLGVQFNIDDRFEIGAHVFNPIGASWTSAEEDRLPMILRLGVRYLASDKVRFLLETEKNSRYKAQIKGGFEYFPHELIAVRIGFSTQDSQLHFGFGINASQFRIDFANAYHPTLGHSPQIGLVFTGKEKTN